MASRFVGLNVGQADASVTDALTTQSKGVEIQIDLSKVSDRIEAIATLENLLNYVKGKMPWPPATE